MFAPKDSPTVQPAARHREVTLQERIFPSGVQLAALFLVQSLGLAVALMLAFAGRNCYHYPDNTFGNHVLWNTVLGIPINGPFAILWPAIALTFFLFWMTRPGVNGTCNFFRRALHIAKSLSGTSDAFIRTELKDKKWWPLCNLKRATILLAALDMLGAAFCIKATGGAEGSIFTPFLLLVPTIIVLIDIFDVYRVAVWGGFCVAMFALSIEDSPGFSHLDPALVLHHWLLTISTALCIFFPFIYLRSSRRKIRCPICSGTGFLTQEAATAAGSEPTSSTLAAPIDRKEGKMI